MPIGHILFQVRAASDRYISGSYDDAEVDAGEDDSDVICLDEEDAAESERRKLAMSPRAPATKDEAPAKTKDSEKEVESSEEGDENESSEE
jgi:hypothetical protein